MYIITLKSNTVSLYILSTFDTHNTYHNYLVTYHYNLTYNIHTVGVTLKFRYFSDSTQHAIGSLHTLCIYTRAETITYFMV